jgi:integrase
MKSVRAITYTQQVGAVSAALRDFDIRFHFLWELGISTGLRISDLLTLRPMDISSCRFTITEKKTGTVRSIKLPIDTYCLLKGYSALKRLKGSDYLFYRTYKGIEIHDMPMSRQWAWRIISRTASKMGLESIGTHSMRKIYACGLFRRCGSLKAVQDELGHKDLATTLLYLKDLLKDLLES